MILSILIPTIPGRERKLAELLAFLENQALAFNNVEILVFRDNQKRTTGEKRNSLISISKGEYFSFVDDDDSVTDDYISSIVNALSTKPDLVCFKVWVSGYQNIGLHDRVAVYDTSFIDENLLSEYRRKPNHIMVWKKALVEANKFSAISYGEDSQWAAIVTPLVRNVVKIDKILYYYKFDCNDNSQTRNRPK